MRSEFSQGHSDPKMVFDIDASTHQIRDSYLKQCRRYAPDMIIQKTRSEVKVNKVTVTETWYATLHYLKMQAHTKFGIPTSNNVGDILIFSGHDHSIKEVRGQGHSDPKMVCYTLPSQDASIH